MQDASEDRRTDCSGGTTCLWRGERAKERAKTRTLADANFVAICETALRLEGPIGDIAANVKHGYHA